MLPDWFLYRTHCQVLGTSQSGKSKFCELCIEEIIMAGGGVTVIDFKGTLYRNVLDWCCIARPPQEINLFDLSGGEFVTPIAVFDPQGDLSAHVDRLAKTILKSWGDDLNDMPTYEDTVKCVLTILGRGWMWSCRKP